MTKAFFERPKVVFHLASLFANQNSLDHPERDLMVNGMGTLRMLSLSKQFGVERFVYTSSSAAYDGIASLPASEICTSRQLRTPYQITKVLGEEYCKFFTFHHGLSIAIARVFNCYGPGEIPGKYRNVVPNFVYSAMKGLPLPITGTGAETRDFTFVVDVVEGLLAMGILEDVAGLTLNLGSGIETSILELAKMINREVGNKAGMCYKPRRKWDSQVRRLASTKLSLELMDFRALTELSEGLRLTIHWFRENWECIQSNVVF